MSVARRLGFALLYTAFLLAFVALVDYVVFWRPFVAELRQAQPSDLTPPAHVDRATMLRVGSLRADRSSSFTRFTPAKPEGVLRLCAFGDSFTYGEEVADGHDYPALLQRVFEERGASNIEVLNFGNPWYGFHQAYALWDGVGRGFDCDAILLGPSCFQEERDTTFNHTNLGSPYYLHARYVAEGEGVRLVEVLGDDAERRFEEYFSFVPRLRYLRYDRSAPAFLHSVVGIARTLDNPFYYDPRPSAAEARATYASLLAEMADAGPPILLLHMVPEIVELANALARDDVVAVLAPGNTLFPLGAPGGHYSGFGNRRLAEQYYAALTGVAIGPAAFGFSALDTMPVPVGGTAPPVAISDFDRIEAKLGGTKAGVLAVLSSDPGRRVGAPEQLSSRGVTSLVALVPGGASVAGAVFVPVPIALRGGEPLTMTIARAGGAERVALGEVAAPDALVSFGVADLPGLEIAGDLIFRGNRRVTEALVRDAAVSISVADVEILRATSGTWPLVLTPVHGDAYGLAAGSSQYASPETLAEQGILSLALERLSETIEIPVAAWRRQRDEPLHGPRRVARPIVITGGRASLSAGASGAAPVP